MRLINKGVTFLRISTKETRNLQFCSSIRTSCFKKKVLNEFAGEHFRKKTRGAYLGILIKKTR